MASFFQYLLSSALFLSLISASHTDTAPPTQAPSPAPAGHLDVHELLLPVAKDSATLQYVTTLQQRIPLRPLKLVLDLGGRLLWVDCERRYVSSTYRPGPCLSSQCKLAGATGCGLCFAGQPKPGCNNNTCTLSPENTVTGRHAVGELAEDVLALRSVEGPHLGRLVMVPHVLFSCAPARLLQGLAGGTNGMVGLGRSLVSLPSQLARRVRIHPSFTICLSSSPKANGVIFFGGGPYVLLAGKEISGSLAYTSLVEDPSTTETSPSHDEISHEYFIQLQSIMINNKRLPINSSLLSINRKGFGGTKISTATPFTTLHSSIYHPFLKYFIREAASMNLTRVRSVPPFGACFSQNNITSLQRTGTGNPTVPLVDLVLHGNVFWRVFGANSMVHVTENVSCLAFVDGGSNPKTSVVIGGHQLEDHLIHFDIVNSRLGFTSSLLFIQATCANFNLTSKG